ncbi:MAG: Bax inhibitor-1/YccA family protein [Armatimonadetes bacterium]|nr:Bax inhibitor-1/YccA family protein [Armatimonadota bacterium]
MRSGNPALSDKTFAPWKSAQLEAPEPWTSSTTVRRIPQPGRMSLEGVVNKTGLMLLFLTASASWTWSLAYAQSPLVMPLMFGGLGLGFITALITIFKKEWSPYTSLPYAMLEGLALGGISAFFEGAYPGIVLQAVGCTFGTLFCLLAAYRSGLIKPTENFKLGVVAATGGIAVFYLISIGLGFFGIQAPLIHESGPVGILFSLFVVSIAALNLILDFDFIESGVEVGAPKFMEWYASFGLMVTLIWLYLEFLRLLAKSRR